LFIHWPWIQSIIEILPLLFEARSLACSAWLIFYLLWRFRVMRAFALSILLLLPCSAFAASTTSPAAPTAPAVHGVVADSTGAIVPGAEVDLLDTNGSVAGSIHSDEEGNFQIVAPHTGSFTLVVSEPGFDTVRTPVTIGAPTGGSGATGPSALSAALPALVPMHIVLPIAAVASTVHVNGDS
jgi:hypothetical protein